MAEQGTDDHDEENTLYKPPAEKKLDEILSADAEDESLKKYKETLLGSAAGGGGTIVDENNPSRVIVQKLGLLVEGRDELYIDLTKDKHEIKKKSFVIKEGCTYRVRIYFYVQREIVTGLKYKQKASRGGIKVDKTNFMVGSYGPKMDLQSFTTPPEEAPSGMVARGEYKMDSQFTDDDGNDYLSWEWKLQIKKDWQ
ncbi:rho GDP-dissociation inhibitor 1 [Patella vulgata]|uniref:rho GDP-dissociation inhibitor 1 n=1 Tax=Patella vulgata TaxID=6465 RepID=UPI0021803015|nr:rho GDP-dissociation inhibitor 1 [Patella vulgata]